MNTAIEFLKHIFKDLLSTPVQKKPLDEMDCEDANALFGSHSDYGHFKYPLWHGIHDNGWRITNRFTDHIKRANRKELERRFALTEKQRKEIYGN